MAPLSRYAEWTSSRDPVVWLARSYRAGQPGSFRGAAAWPPREQDPSATASRDTALPTFAPPPPKYLKARAYRAARERHYFVNALYGLLIPLFLLRWCLGAKYRDWAERISSRRWAQAMVYAPAMFLTMGVLKLPSSVWDHSLDLSFGHSLQNWRSWLVEWTAMQAVGLVTATILAWALYAVIRRTRRRWWLVVGVAMVASLVLSRVLLTRTIPASFYEPLQDRYPELVTDMENVARHAGERIPPEGILEWHTPYRVRDDSSRIEQAGVMDVGVPARIVFWESLIDDATRPEILFVFGHEMGHHVLRHSFKKLVIEAVIVLGLVYGGSRMADWMLERWGQRWASRSEDWASLPLLLFLLAALGFLEAPAFNTTSRYFEHEADRYGLEVIHGIVPDPGEAAVGVFRLCDENCGVDPNPSPLIRIWLYDHPTDSERNHFAATYNPWSLGGEPRYVR